MAEKTWTDQPDAVTAASISSQLTLKLPGQTTQAEIRKNGKGYFLTVGNLFGSQTMHAPDADAVFWILSELNKRGEPLRLPDGWLMENKGE